MQTGQWIPVEEAINYYHLHPKEYVQHRRELMDSDYSIEFSEPMFHNAIIDPAQHPQHRAEP